MALGLFRRLLGNRKEIEVDAAGVHAVRGQLPSLHAIAVCRKRGIDISDFRSQPLTATLVERATHIFAMTASHLETIHLLFPEGAEKTFLLREFEEPGATLWRDLPDPIGMGYHVYHDCADAIEKALPSVLAYVEDSGPPRTQPSFTPNAPGKSSTQMTPQDTESKANRGNDAASLGGGLRRVDPEIFAAIAEEEKRQRALHRDVVHAMVHQILADGTVASREECDFQLRAHAVDRADEHWLAHFRKRVTSAESSNVRQYAGSERLARHFANRCNGAVRLIDIDTGFFVGNSAVCNHLSWERTSITIHL